MACEHSHLLGHEPLDFSPSICCARHLAHKGQPSKQSICRGGLHELEDIRPHRLRLLNIPKVNEGLRHLPSICIENLCNTLKIKSPQPCAKHMSVHAQHSNVYPRHTSVHAQHAKVNAQQTNVPAQHKTFHARHTNARAGHKRVMRSTQNRLSAAHEMSTNTNAQAQNTQVFMRRTRERHMHVHAPHMNVHALHMVVDAQHTTARAKHAHVVRGTRVCMRRTQLFMQST